MLKGLQKQVKDVEATLRDLLKQRKAHVKGARLRHYLTIEEVCYCGYWREEPEKEPILN